MATALTNNRLPAPALGAAGTDWRSKYLAPAVKTTGNVFRKYGPPALAVGAAVAIPYYGYTDLALKTIGGLSCAYGVEQWAGMRGRLWQSDTSLISRCSAAWNAFNDPKPAATPEKIAFLTAQMEHQKKLKDLQEKEKALKEKIKEEQKTLKDLESLRWKSSSIIKEHKMVQEVLDRGPTKKSSAKGLKSKRVDEEGTGKCVDVDDLVEQFLRNLKKQKYFNGKGGLVRPTWKSHEASADTLAELDKLVGADEGQISKDDKDAVWKKIRLVFQEF